VFAGTVESKTGSPATDDPAVAITANPVGAGYLIATSLGTVYAFGGSPFYGSPSLLGVTPASPLVALQYTPDGTGYWLVGADGGIFNFNATQSTGTGSTAKTVTTGDANYYGALPGKAGASASSPVVGFAPTL
jgi:hypothetical protein